MTIVRRTERVVLTGGSGAGKTTTINALRNVPDVWTVEEPATVIMQESFRTGSDLVPWIKLMDFVKVVTERCVRDFKEAPKNKPSFFDRGIPDSVAFLRLDNLDIPDWLLKACTKNRYNRIYWAPPWKEIYVNTKERPESWEFAEELGYLLRDVYKDLGYHVLEIPRDTVANRVKFLLR